MTGFRCSGNDDGGAAFGSGRADASGSSAGAKPYLATVLGS